MTENGASFVKLKRSPETYALLRENPKAFNLLTLIALRVTIKKNPISKLLPGQCFLGDPESAGMTRGEYRAALGKLEKMKLIEICSATRKGTVALLKNSKVFDLSMGGRSITTERIGMDAAADLIIDYLNEKSGKKFRYTESNRKWIRARMKEGFHHQDFVKVVDSKLRDPYFVEHPQYIRPATLFSGKNFEGYLNNAGKIMSADERLREAIANA